MTIVCTGNLFNETNIVENLNVSGELIIPASASAPILNGNLNVNGNLYSYNLTTPINTRQNLTVSTAVHGDTLVNGKYVMVAFDTDKIDLLLPSIALASPDNIFNLAIALTKIPTGVSKTLSINCNNGDTFKENQIIFSRSGTGSLIIEESSGTDNRIEYTTPTAGLANNQFFSRNSEIFFRSNQSKKWDVFINCVSGPTDNNKGTMQFQTLP
tara:strand:- start:126 stop:764 length:639 start_codon:yes stop_codon:yes gene_type:complete